MFYKTNVLGCLCCVVSICGCVGRGPALVTERAASTGDHVFLEVCTSTRHSSFEGSGWYDNPVRYVLSYPLAGLGAGAGRTDHIVRIRSIGELPADVSVGPFARFASERQADLGAGPSGTPEPVNTAAYFGSDWFEVGRWAVALPMSSSALQSTDRRYLAALSPPVGVFDTATSRPVADAAGSITRMLEMAKRIASGPGVSYTLTRNLSYVAVSCSWAQLHVPENEIRFIAGGMAAVLYAKECVVVIDLHSGHPILAIRRDILGDQFLAGIDESDNAELLLLYRAFDPPGAFKYLIRDKSLNVVAEATIPEIHVGLSDALPDPAWDTARHCVWFYTSTVYFPEFKNPYVTLLRWDYITGGVRQFDFDVANAFKKGTLQYIPIRP
jgi:hypothetical protein